jgi:hypothetical protein
MGVLSRLFGQDKAKSRNRQKAGGRAADSGPGATVRRSVEEDLAMLSLSCTRGG